MTALKTSKILGLAALAALACALPALGQDAPAPEVVEEVATIDTGDTAWMFVSTIIVILMTIPGLALFYGGLVRGKNVLSVFTQAKVANISEKEAAAMLSAWPRG